MKRFLVTDNRGQMEVFNEAELKLLELFRFDSLSVEDYTEETEAAAEEHAAEFYNRQPFIPFELEILDLYRERVPF